MYTYGYWGGGGRGVGGKKVRNPETIQCVQAPFAWVNPRAWWQSELFLPRQSCSCSFYPLFWSCSGEMMWCWERISMVSAQAQPDMSASGTFREQSPGIIPAPSLSSEPTSCTLLALSPPGSLLLGLWPLPTASGPLQPQPLALSLQPSASAACPQPQAPFSLSLQPSASCPQPQDPSSLSLSLPSRIALSRSRAAAASFDYLSSGSGSRGSTWAQLLHPCMHLFSWWYLFTFLQAVMRR